jgi:hypothetical protein
MNFGIPEMDFRLRNFSVGCAHLRDGRPRMDPDAIPLSPGRGNPQSCEIPQDFKVQHIFCDIRRCGVNIREIVLPDATENGYRETSDDLCSPEICCGTSRAPSSAGGNIWHPSVHAVPAGTLDEVNDPL